MGDPLYNIQLTTNSQTREWICQSSALPVFLTTMRQSLLARKGTSMVSSTICNDTVSPFLLGWGDTGVQETSTDKLQETVVPIVQTSNCTARMNQTDGVDENLIVCTGGAAQGPCKVQYQNKMSYYLIYHDSSLGRQWWATHNSEWGRCPHSCWDRQQKAWRELQPAGLHRLHQRLCSPAMG